MNLFIPPDANTDSKNEDSEKPILNEALTSEEDDHHIGVTKSSDLSSAVENSAYSYDDSIVMEPSEDGLEFIENVAESSEEFGPPVPIEASISSSVENSAFSYEDSVVMEPSEDGLGFIENVAESSEEIDDSGVDIHTSTSTDSVSMADVTPIPEAKNTLLDLFTPPSESSLESEDKVIPVKDDPRYTFKNTVVGSYRDGLARDMQREVKER